MMTLFLLNKHNKIMNIDILGIGEVVVDWVAEVPHFPKADEKIDSISQDKFSGGFTAN